MPITNTTDSTLVITKITDARTLTQICKTRYLVIYPYEKAICQAVVLPVPKMRVSEVSLDELKSIESKRGDGCLGSSGK